MNENIKEIVEEEMKIRGLKQKGLAKLCGVSQPTISRLLSGGDLKLNSLRKIYQGLKLPFLLDVYDRKALYTIKASLETRT